MFKHWDEVIERYQGLLISVCVGVCCVIGLFIGFYHAGIGGAIIFAVVGAIVGVVIFSWLGFFIMLLPILFVLMVIGLFIWIAMLSWGVGKP